MQKDKVLHFVISALIIIFLNIFLSTKMAVIITLGIGILKEVVWDYALNKGTASKMDLLADFLGTLAGLIVCLLV